MGEVVKVYSITFEELRDASERRNNEKFPECKSWSLCDWVTSLVGEIGEASNIIKKIKLGRFPCRGTSSKPIFSTPQDAFSELAGELADCQIYLDSLAREAGINLEKAVRKKFNEKSLELGSEVTL